MSKKNALGNLYTEQKTAMTEFCEGYKDHLSACKTERECVTDMVKQAKSYGYEDLDDVIASKKTLKPGDKVYAVNRGKMLVLVQVGEKP